MTSRAKLPYWCPQRRRSTLVVYDCILAKNKISPQPLFHPEVLHGLGPFQLLGV